jgi:hydrogenase large subunit
MARLTIDPITRIEGHLRIDVEVEKAAVSKAWASCTMWRGIENILVGRDPREAWIFTQRFCGVCTTVHALASVRAVEDALQLEIPLNAQLIRNLIAIAHAMHDHVVHFYHLSALDWVDVATLPKADPVATSKLAESLSPWPHNSVQELRAVQQKVKAILDSGKLGIFAGGAWGHPAMKLPPDVNLLAVSHYLQALEVQRAAHTIVAILGAKTPHIQNLAVGGVANAINLNSLATLNMDKLYQVKAAFDILIPFIQNVYLPDVCAVAAFYPEWFKIGKGVTNYIAAPELPLDSKATKFDMLGGAIMGGNVAGVRPITGPRDPVFRGAVVEDVTHAYYEGKGALHPHKGETKAVVQEFDENGKYTYVKAPRFEGKPAQVGPLASVLVNYAQGHALTKKYTDHALKTIAAIGKRPVTIDDLHSTMGRIAARAIRTAVMAEQALSHWQRLVDNIVAGDTRIFAEPVFPKGAVEGTGIHEAPRGLLSHWVVVENGVLTNYQAVVPTTWNAAPRDAQGVSGPYEASLLGTPIANQDQPLEVVRTVHSYDPCMACACHAHDASGKEVATVHVGTGETRW